jgi:hypothetical protein
LVCAVAAQRANADAQDRAQDLRLSLLAFS